jgi:hypothetical protein
MSYWVKRIALVSGEVVTEQELRADENRFVGPAPVVGDIMEVTCRGRAFAAKVVWGNWPERAHSDDEVVSLRVSEVGLDEDQTPLWFVRKSPGKPDRKMFIGKG